jgi:hypothetical protein
MPKRAKVIAAAVIVPPWIAKDMPRLAMPAARAGMTQASTAKIKAPPMSITVL